MSDTSNLCLYSLKLSKPDIYSIFHLLLIPGEECRGFISKLKSKIVLCVVS